MGDYVEARDALAAMVEVAPEMVEDHMMSADAVEESILTQAACFTSNLFPSQWTIPG